MPPIPAENSTDLSTQSDDESSSATNTDYAKEGEIMLPKDVPEINDAFQGCKVGDMYKVTADDDMGITLMKTPAGDEGPVPDADDTALANQGKDDEKVPSSDNPSIALMISRKMKR